MDYDTSGSDGWRGERHVMHRVVEAVAAERGVDPVTVDAPLFDAVEPDALETLFEQHSTTTPRDEGYVQFPFEDVIVRLYASGRLEVSSVDAIARSMGD